MHQFTSYTAIAIRCLVEAHRNPFHAICLTFDEMKSYRRQNSTGLSVGLVFDGDSDRIAAVDGQETSSAPKF